MILSCLRTHFWNITKDKVQWKEGFRFLKDKSFRVSEVYLKKNSRIQALAMIMVLCLFIYSMVEFRLRRALERKGETVISQTKKQTQTADFEVDLFPVSESKGIFCCCSGKTDIENI